MKRCTRRRQRTLFKKLRREILTDGGQMIQTPEVAVDRPRRSERP